MDNSPFGRAEEKRWRVTSARTLTENPSFRVQQQEVTLPGGRSTTYYSLDFRGVAVGVVARHEGRILLVRQYRFLVDQFVWAIPFGGAGAAEDHAEAARRELEEETGHSARTLRPLLACFPSYGCGNQRFALFETTDVAPTGKPFDPDEILEVRWFPEAEVAVMLGRGDIGDGRSLAPPLLLSGCEGWLR